MTRIVLTQPIPRVGRLSAQIRAHGHETLEFPARRLSPRAEASGWVSHLADRHDWVIFVSPGAVGIALDGFMGDWPSTVGIAVVGPGSAAELARHSCIGAGVRIVQPAIAPYDADSLLRTAPFDAPRGLRILVLRGVSGRDDWIARLDAQGAQVQVLALYRSVAEPAQPEARARLVRWAQDGRAVVFSVTSADALDPLDALLAGAGLTAWARSCEVLTQHPRIAQALRDRGWSCVRTVAPGDDGLLAGIESPGRAAENG